MPSTAYPHSALQTRLDDWIAALPASARSVVIRDSGWVFTEEHPLPMPLPKPIIIELLEFDVRFDGNEYAGVINAMGDWQIENSIMTTFVFWLSNTPYSRTEVIIRFTNAADAVAFKLRWLK